jgi:hypothetical protein
MPASFSAFHWQHGTDEEWPTSTRLEVRKVRRKMSSEVPAAVTDMRLWAWVGEDELGSGETGLKQAHTPCGLIPLVACEDGKLDQHYIRDQMQAQAAVCGKKIMLVRFVFERVIETLEP